MKWEEIRKKYPNRFIRFKVLESHKEGDLEIADNIEVLKVINEDEIDNEFRRLVPNEHIFNTDLERVGIRTIRVLGVRRFSHD